ncbi:helix-turn-helix domain-containing protein [Enterococcus nangangensis]|uniref:helix-turn-helix domain-containing protein n=1 Tax=Enterococcus nangangensis TaxID=2559926 RepID=UPI001485C20E|nr:helix-turn-helix domain-containing protein [Enterococcus nangangensis]
MRVLIVDDDRYIIKALQEKINWPALGAKEVFAANNMRKAQEIIQSQAIDLLISDIEMPQGSGLQLLSWVRQENFEIQTIFLTNYADFNYAQKAIELQSFEYYLKPIEFDKLELIIHKALKKIAEKKEQQKQKQVADPYLVEMNFWYKYLYQPTTSSLQQLLADPQTELLGLQRDTLLYPCIFTFSLSQETAFTLGWEQTLQEHLRQSLQLLPQLKLAALFKAEQRPESYRALFYLTPTADENLVLRQLQHLLQQKMQQDIQFLTTGKTTLQELFLQTQTLLQISNFFTGHQQQLYFFQSPNFPTTEYQGCNLDINSLLLKSDIAPTLLTQDFQKYETNGLIETTILKSWRLDFLQKIDSYLAQKGILAHKLFQNTTHDFLLQRCYNSIESFTNYLRYYVTTAQNYLHLADSKQSIAKILIDYINQHYTEDLNRKTLSEIVFLSPDHLARLFKKETGETLINYITQKRLEAAKDLLQHTDSPVYLIASQVGYDNYSYFSKLFKKETGYAPLDYRNLN